MLFSVIIPIYNVEIYLRKCIDSVINQTYKNLEIILVDDGSPDKCPEICDEYAKKDKRIIVIHKENGGLSDARNVGIKNATGEYILFLDSDDYWNSNNFLINIYKCIINNNPDIVIFNNALLKNNKITNKYKFNIEKYNNYTLSDLIDKNIFNFGAADKCIKSSIIFKQKLYFKKNIYSEDINWWLNAIQYIKSVNIVNDSFYIYRYRKNSISKSIKNKNINDLLNTIKYYSDLYANNKIDVNLKNSIFGLLNFQLCLIFGYVHLIHNKNFKKQYFSDLKNYIWLLKYKNNNKGRYLSSIINIFGINIGSYIIYLLLRYK